MAKEGTKDAQIIVKLRSEQKHKLAYLVWHGRTDITDLVTKHIDSKIAAFEKKHGEITEQQLKDARIIK